MSSETSGSSWLVFSMFMDCSISCQSINQSINQSCDQSEWGGHAVWRSSYPSHLGITGVEDFRKKKDYEERKKHHENLREWRLKREAVAVVTGREWFHTRVGIDSYQFPVSIPMWFKKNEHLVKHLDIKHIYSAIKLDSIKSCLCAKYSGMILDKLRLVFLNGVCSSLTIQKKKH